MAEEMVGLMKNYDLTIHYHPKKANIAVDALSQKSGGTLATLITRQLRCWPKGPSL